MNKSRIGLLVASGGLLRKRAIVCEFNGRRRDMNSKNNSSATGASTSSAGIPYGGGVS